MDSHALKRINFEPTVMPAECRSSLWRAARVSTFSDGSTHWLEGSSCWRCAVRVDLGDVDGRKQVQGREGAAQPYPEEAHVLLRLEG